jgi:glycosyltransferase involved in cell wall biosynthesis
MATHEPPHELFERQIASIKEQTYVRFVCIVCDDASSPEARARIVRASADDPRFVVLENDRRVGFYRNFERCLRAIPAEASFVALADQDDRWHPDKLATLLSAIDGTCARLAYSDMNIVTTDGRTLSTTYWVGRSNNRTSLSSLLLMNTVTGGAALVRRDAVEDALPFPAEIGRPFHDHWLACVALAGGEFAYVDRPLYDYVQHAENVAGTFVSSSELEGGAVHALGRMLSTRGKWRHSLGAAATTYQDELVRVELFAKTIELRLGDRVVPSRRSAVRRGAHITESGMSFLWLLRRSLRDVSGKGGTLGVENHLLEALAWRRVQAFRRMLLRLRRGA